MNVLSLFDGISCGYLALKRAGIHNFTYYASEIDPYAIEVSQRVSSDIIRLGDVCQIKSSDLPKIDLLIGGSPCQGFSLLNQGGSLGLDHPESRLFLEFSRLYHESKPRYFLFENVWMQPKWRHVITFKLGVKPLRFNSSLVSAQNRPRLYWTNIPIGEIPDYKKHQTDILEFPVSECKEKSSILTTRPPMIGDRRYTPLEYERLQTLPEGLTEGIPVKERYKLIGNAWTVDLITLFFQKISSS
jgi:DNA (cytosine-5)-methyltransferase 3A